MQTIKVTTKTTYDFEINGHHFTQFRKISEWEGFIRYKNLSGQELIVSKQDQEESDLLNIPFLSSILWTPKMEDGHVTELVLIKASPDIIHAFMSDPKKQGEAAA